MQKLKTNKNLTSHLAPHTSNNNNCRKIVGALSVRNTKEDNQTAPIAHKGITLIALIITIIIMLILVAVTITVALDTGLFDKAKEGAKDTEVEADRETLIGAVAASVETTGEGLRIKDAATLQGNLPDGWSVTGPDGEGVYTVTSQKGNKFTIDVNGEINYVGEEEPTPPPSLPEGWTETEKLPEWDNDRITAVTDGTTTIPLPDGYQISDNPEENTIEKGVVIKDSKGNEFVWIPITEDFENSYSGDTNYSEPTELTSNYSSSGAAYDSQGTLDYLYGENYYNYETDFAYSTHYAEMVESVNKYNGFYIGRYETTIDENNEIGSLENTTVLTMNETIPQANNKECRWYGLYYTERNSNVTGNSDYIQTNMIWGQQWDKMLEYFDSKSLDYDPFGESSQGEVVNSGQSTNSSNEKDKIYNIFDLRTNCWDWTAEAYSTDDRTLRGGIHYISNSASFRYYNYNPSNLNSVISSRLTLYIR